MKRTQIRPVSARRRRANVERRRVVAELMLTRGPLCQAQIAAVCINIAVDAHEVLTRARGGSITDPANILLVCRTCHRWIGDNPDAATERGLIRSALRSN